MKKIIRIFIVGLLVVVVAGIVKSAYDHYLDDKINHDITKELQSLAQVMSIHKMIDEPITINEAFEQKTYHYITKEKVIYSPPTSPAEPVTSSEEMLKTKGIGILITVYRDGHATWENIRAEQVGMRRHSEIDE